MPINPTICSAPVDPEHARPGEDQTRARRHSRALRGMRDRRQPPAAQLRVRHRFPGHLIACPRGAIAFHHLLGFGKVEPQAVVIMVIGDLPRGVRLQLVQLAAAQRVGNGPAVQEGGVELHRRDEPGFFFAVKIDALLQGRLRRVEGGGDSAGQMAVVAAGLLREAVEERRGAVPVFDERILRLFLSAGRLHGKRPVALEIEVGGDAGPPHRHRLGEEDAVIDEDGRLRHGVDHGELPVAVRRAAVHPHRDEGLLVEGDLAIGHRRCPAAPGGAEDFRRARELRSAAGALQGGVAVGVAREHLRPRLEDGGRILRVGFVAGEDPQEGLGVGGDGVVAFVGAAVVGIRIRSAFHDGARLGLIGGGSEAAGFHLIVSLLPRLGAGFDLIADELEFGAVVEHAGMGERFCEGQPREGEEAGAGARAQGGETHGFLRAPSAR